MGAGGEKTAIGRLLGGRYELLERIGAGGMGAVYLGKQVDLDRRVAIKILHPNLEPTPGLIGRFRQEAEAAKRLTHPNTVRLYDFGEGEDGQLFLVLEYLDGVPLDKLLRDKGRIALPLVGKIGEQVLKSLIEAHHHGVIHRDIKPSNLMLCDQPGEPDLIKVLDFGVARLNEEGAHQTATGALVGTPHYMSPEQALGNEIDFRSDLYSLGVTLMELATGRLPYNDRSPLRVAMQHADSAPIELPDWLRLSPIGSVLDRSLAKSVDDRYASADDMRLDLASVDWTSYDSVVAPTEGQLASTDILSPTATSPGALDTDQAATRFAPPTDRGGARHFKAIGLLGGCLIVCAVAVALWVNKNEDNQVIPDPVGDSADVIAEPDVGNVSAIGDADLSIEPDANQLETAESDSAEDDVTEDVRRRDRRRRDRARRSEPEQTARIETDVAGQAEDVEVQSEDQQAETVVIVQPEEIDTEEQSAPEAEEDVGRPGIPINY